MVGKALKKIISLVLVSSLLIGNVFTYIEARDLKLSIIYMLDTIEDMEYKERESVYESEHLSFLSKDEEETTNSNEYEEEPEDDTESESQECTTNTDESENTDTSVEEKQESNNVTSLSNSDDTIVNREINTIATNSDVSEEDNNNSGNIEEPEDDIIGTESITLANEEETTTETIISEETTYINENENVATNSNIVDTEENENISTKSEIEEVIAKELIDELVVATESEIFDIRVASSSNALEPNLFGSGLFGAGQELFTFPVSSSDFTLRAVTKKSRRGGQTCLGVIVCGIMQTPFHTNPNSFLQSECTHEDRHVVELNVYKEDEEGNDVFVSTQTCSPGSIAYPDYTSFGSTFTESKVYNMQSGLFSINTPLRLNTIYNITEKASGCASYTTQDVDVGENYQGPPPPIKAKHTGAKVYDTVDGGTDMVRTVDSSTFLFYKVQYGDVLEKLAMHYGVEANDIGVDNHFSRLMCYEGDILFIRDPITAEPYENDLTPAQVARLKQLINTMGYEAAMCAMGLEPVNMSTGDFYLDHTDISVPELGDTNFEISRSYNSIGSIIKSDFGYGFNTLVNDRLMVEDNGTVMHFRADGGGETYMTNGDSTYTASKGYNVLKAVKDENGSSYVDDEYDDSGDEEDLPEDDDGGSVGRSNFWQLFYEDGSVATYNGYGTLLSKTDKKGLTYTYTYDSRYRLTSIAAPSGFRVTFSHNDKNLISRVTLPDGTFIKYEYDEYKNLIKVIDAENRTITYKYDDNGVDPKDHLMTSWYDSDGIRQVLNTYDSSNRVIKQIDANGNETTIRYESDRTILTDNEGHEQVFMLDSKKRTTEQLFGSNEDVNNNLVEPEYTKVFNNTSRVETETGGNGVITTYTYDGKGNVINEAKTDGTYTISRSWTYDESSNKTSETDFNGNTTSYTYDARNNLTKITDPNGNTEEITYDSLSRMTSKKDKNGNITRWTYSGNNPLPETMTDARGSVTRYTYDGMRRKTSETDAEGYTTQITYDRTGRKLKETDKRGNETNYTYSSRGIVTKIKDREDNETTFTYDNVGNILTGTDNENNTLTYEYDRNYNKILDIE